MNFINQIDGYFWYRFSCLLLLTVSFNKFVLACECPGVEVAVSGHDFCFEIQRSPNASWADADQKCLTMGGFLAHLDSNSLITSIKSYVQSNYQRPLLTGGLLGNAEYQLIALMCPNNTFMSLLNTTIASDIINGNASSTSGSCLFLENSDYKLHYENCNSTFDILCQIPMNDTQTCGVMMQCASNSSSTLSAGITVTQSSRPSSQSSNSQSSNSQNSNQQNSNQQNSNQQSSNPQSSTQQSSQTSLSTIRVISSTISSVNNSQAVSNSNQSGKPSFSSPVSNNTSLNGTSPPISIQDFNLNMDNPTQDIPIQSDILSPLENLTGNTSITSKTYSTAVSMLLSSIAPNSSLKSTSKLPSNSTENSWPTSNTNPWSDNSTDNSNGCGSGYTKIGKWCLPWWAWLVFGVLLFMVFFTLAICLVCICIGNRKKRVATAENYEKLNSEYTGKQIRPSSEPPRSIYDNNNDYLAPAPYSAPNNNSPIYI